MCGNAPESMMKVRLLFVLLLFALICLQLILIVEYSVKESLLAFRILSKSNSCSAA